MDRGALLETSLACVAVPLVMLAVIGLGAILWFTLFRGMLRN